MTLFLRALYRVLTDARALADTQDALTRSEVSNASLEDVVNELRSELRLAELDRENAIAERERARDSAARWMSLPGVEDRLFEEGQ